MSDIKQAVAKAVSELKSLAAKEMVRREEAEATLAKLEKDKAKLEATLDAAVDQGDDETAMRLITAKDDLESKIAVQQTAISEAQTAFDAAKNEIQSLKADAKTAEAQADRLKIKAAAGVPSFDSSAEDAALANVRQHIQSLDAQVKLENELAGKPTALEEKKEAELRAKAKLAALKAARRGGSVATDDTAAAKRTLDAGDAEGSSDSSESSSDDKNSPPKRTL